MKKRIVRFLSVVLAVSLTVSLFPLFSFAKTKGDVDGNGVIDSADARLALRASVRLEDILPGTDAFFAADVNNDGMIGSDDARLILRVSLRLDSFPDTHEHSYTEKITKEPSCTENGEKTLTCECGDVKTEVIPAKGHVEEKIPAAPASCSAPGNTEGIKCSVCGEILSKPEELPVTDHTWDGGTKTVPGTCTGKAVITYACLVCGAERTEEGETDPGNHDYQPYSVGPTCVEDGYTELKCTLCGDEKDKVTVPADPDRHNIQTVTQEPTCTTDGYTVTGCANEGCYYIIEGTFVPGEKATGHSFETEETAASTCTENGYTRMRCKVCGAMEDRDMIPAAGHAPGSYAVTVPATCTADGVETALCTVCGEKITRDIPAKGHLNIQTDKFVKQACEIRTYCEDCGTVFSSKEYHEFAAVGRKVPATCTSEGSQLQKCNYCGTERTLIIPKTDHKSPNKDDIVSADCTHDGHIIYGGGNCIYCGTPLSTETVVIPAKGHTPGTAATCTSPQRCEVCKEIVTPALGHSCVPENNVLGADTKGFYCIRCGEKSSSKAELIATFNDLVNGIKKPYFYNAGDGRTAASFGKTSMTTAYTKFDFGIYTPAVKELYDTEMNGAEITYDPIKPQTTMSVYYQTAYTGFVSRLEEKDVDSITVEKISSISSDTLLSDFDAKFKIGSREYDTTPYRGKTVNGDIIKVTVDIRDEYIHRNGGSNITDDPGELTSIGRIYNYDIREERRLYDENWQITESETGEGYDIGMNMTLDKIDSDAEVIYYFDAGTYDPIAAVYNISTTMDQDVDMRFKIGIFSLGGIIKPFITTDYSTVYLFSDYFGI